MKIPCLMVCLALACSVVLAQVDTAWVRRFNGNFDSTDMATAMTYARGGVYVTGHSLDDDTIEDFFSFRREADGSDGWYRRYDGRGDTITMPYALAVDSAGNCYVAGKTYFADTRFDWMTVKHDSAGSVQWATYHDGALHHNDEPRAVAAVPGGGCVVTGAAFGPALNWDFATIKYGAAGETLWVAYYNGTADDGDDAVAIALDTSGSIYVTGCSPGTGTNQDIVTIKYNQAGETLWTHRYVGTGGASDEDKARCIAVDRVQNVYVGGYTEGYGTGRDFMVIKYSGHGDTLWTRRFNGSADDDDEVVGIGTDDRGRVYVCGYSNGTGTFADYVTVCYSPLGESLWAHRWDLGGYGNWPTALAVDADGNCYITGYGFDPVTQYDFHTISLGPDGTPRWQIRYSGYADDWDEPVGIALDADRNVYVAGSSMSNAQGFDYVTIKYVQEPGIEESPRPQTTSPKPGPTIVRSLLMIRDRGRETGNRADLLDAAGRRIFNLVSGPNDVSRLAPGIYFVRAASKSDGADAPAERLVIIR